MYEVECAIRGWKRANGIKDTIPQTDLTIDEVKEMQRMLALDDKRQKEKAAPDGNR